MTQQLTAAEAARGPIDSKWQYKNPICKSGWIDVKPLYQVHEVVFAGSIEPIMEPAFFVRLVPISTPSPSKE